MSKIWYNHPCRFSTKNTLNQLGNSHYSVLITSMTRFAPININRASNQVNTGNPSICYLIPNSKLYDRIMHTTDDSKITIENVILDSIIVNADNFKGLALRKPQKGFVPFDFVNNGGTLTSIHVGHEIHEFLP